MNKEYAIGDVYLDTNSLRLYEVSGIESMLPYAVSNWITVVDPNSGKKEGFMPGSKFCGHMVHIAPLDMHMLGYEYET
jgi:hypothetical protein